jgi:resolvase-like protein
MRLEKAGALLTELLAYARKGDTLAVVRLARLGRSLSELLGIVDLLRGTRNCVDVWGSVTSFHFSGVDRMLPSGYPSPSG